MSGPSRARPAAVVVLAAGEGTRMRSATPKVLHEIGGRTLLGHALAAATELDPEHLLVVVGHGRDRVSAHVAEVAPGASCVVQEQQNGTGHAVRVALETLPALAGTIVITYGDVPLLTPATLRGLLEAHAAEGNAATMLTAVLADPSGYGRVLRGEDDSVLGVVEQKDADAAQLAIAEVNSGMYAFDAQRLGEALEKVTADNAQGEQYLPDVLPVLRAQGHRVGGVVAEHPVEILGVNDRVQLAEAGRLLRDRVLDGWMRAGVTVVDPATTWVDSTVTLQPDAVLLPGVFLHGRTTVASGARIGPNVTMTDTTVGPGAWVREATVDGAVLEAGSQVGPYTFVRPGTVLRAGARIGGFCETKNADIGPGAKVPHLSYVGDASIGEGTNIGAATVFVNYDGIAKHRTVVGAHARIGSDTMLVAPVVVGDGAYTAAGSVIIDDVPPGAIAVARGKQRNVEGWVARRRAGTPSAAAAASAAARTDDGSGSDEQGSAR